MARELLAVPEEMLEKVIRIIEAGIEVFDDLKEYNEAVEFLQNWCTAEGSYLLDRYSEED